MSTPRNNIYHSIVRDRWGRYIPLHADRGFYEEEFGDQHYLTVSDTEMAEGFEGIGKGGIGLQQRRLVPSTHRQHQA